MHIHCVRCTSNQRSNAQSFLSRYSLTKINRAAHGSCIQVEREIAAIPPPLTDAVDIAAPTHLVQARLSRFSVCLPLFAAYCFRLLALALATTHGKLLLSPR